MADPRPVRRQSAPASPLRYISSFEQLEKDEEETLRGPLDTTRKIRETIYEDTGHAMRSVHVKSHGLLKGEMNVLANLPEPLAQGLFAEPVIYPLVMRLSTSPGDILPDKISRRAAAQ